MSDREQAELTLYLSPEEREKIEELARQRGFEAADDYLRALIEMDAKAQGEDLSLNDDDPAESFRQAWHEIMTGKVRPISELWDALDDE